MSVLVYFKVFDDAESELDDALGATPEQGTTVRNLVAGARRFGLEAEARTGLTLDDLKQELARGAAVIVAVQAWPTKPVTDWRKNWEDGHYVVIVGMSEDRIYVMDPSLRTGYGYFDAREFLDRWHDYDLEGSRRIVYERLGIVIRGDFPLSRYPADPTAIP